MKPVLSRSLVNFRVIRDALVIDLLAGPGSGGPEEAQKLQIVNAGGEPPHIPVQVGADVAGIENVGIGILPADQCRHPAGKDPLKDGRGILAKTDPKMFFQLHKPPLLIDEVQYAPELFPYIKMMVDSRRQPGDFWLTGSQLFSMMEGVQESLAGRVALLQLSPLSYGEIGPVTRRTGYCPVICSNSCSM